MSKVVSALTLAAVFLVAACGSGGSSPSGASHTGAVPHTSTAATKPRTFTSEAYGYTLTVPANWTSRQAYVKWDGKAELDGTSTAADLIGQPGETRGVWAAAARSKLDLAADAAFAIRWTTQVHGDYCPHRPNMKNHVMVGSRPGILLAYNCGILVNLALTVDRGVEYWFSFVDHGVVAATDPADHATFMKMLGSVQLPG
jgi:hypothetical protein